MPVRVLQVDAFTQTLFDEAKMSAGPWISLKNDWRRSLAFD